jgi:hypothetical protein
MYLRYMFIAPQGGGGIERGTAMRHNHVQFRDDYDLVDIAEVWPRPDLGIQLPVAELQHRASPSVPDIPVAVGRGIALVYSGLILAFVLTMGVGGEAQFLITISGVYVAIFLGVPWIFLKTEKDHSDRPSLSQFMIGGVDTWTGHMSGRAALVQIFIVPVFLVGAILAIGLTAAWFLP